MYLYETHLHTKQGSACGRSAGREYVRLYRALGYTGAFITDHFLHGNCAVDRSLPWEQIVRRFCEGYEDCKREGDRVGFSVFFGWEQNFDGDEYLIYGLDPEWLLAHPEMNDWTRQEQFDRVHAYGGAVVQAHPFRDRDYIRRHTLSPLYCDAAEVYNAYNPVPENALCERYCEAFGLPRTAGSDVHNAAAVGPELVAGTATDRPLRSARAFAALLKTGRGFAPALPGQPLPADTAALAAQTSGLLRGLPCARPVKPVWRFLPSGERAADDLRWAKL